MSRFEIGSKGYDYLKPHQLEITDILGSAYFLCSGTDLDGIRTFVKYNPKRFDEKAR